MTFPFAAGRSEDSKLAARFLQQQGYRRVLRAGQRRVARRRRARSRCRARRRSSSTGSSLSEPELARLIEAIEVGYRLSDGLATL
ncbi:MAG: hypothetical protein V9G29_04380 [Burkholderiaceae bacterium]